jgi:hypothetical protein
MKEEDAFEKQQGGVEVVDDDGDGRHWYPRSSRCRGEMIKIVLPVVVMRWWCRGGNIRCPRKGIGTMVVVFFIGGVNNVTSDIFSTSEGDEFTHETRGWVVKMWNVGDVVLTAYGVGVIVRQGVQQQQQHGLMTTTSTTTAPGKGHNNNNNKNNKNNTSNNHNNDSSTTSINDRDDKDDDNDDDDDDNDDDNDDDLWTSIPCVEENTENGKGDNSSNSKHDIIDQTMQQTNCHDEDDDDNNVIGHHHNIEKNDTTFFHVRLWRRPGQSIASAALAILHVNTVNDFFFDIYIDASCTYSVLYTVVYIYVHMRT